MMTKEGLTRERLRNKTLRKEAKDWKIKAGLDREKARLAERCRNRSDRVFKEKLEKELCIIIIILLVLHGVAGKSFLLRAIERPFSG